MQQLKAEAYDELKKFVREEEKKEREKRTEDIRKARQKGRPDPTPRAFAFFEDVMEMAQAEDRDGTVWVLKGEKKAWLNERRLRATP